MSLEEMVRVIVRDELAKTAAPPVRAIPVSEPRLTSEQAAHELGVTLPTVQRWANRGRLRGERQGRQWRFTREALEAFKRGGRRTDPGRDAQQLLRSVAAAE